VVCITLTADWCPATGWDEDPYSWQDNHFVPCPVGGDAGVGALVGGIVDRGRLPVLRCGVVQHEPKCRRDQRSRIGHLPAQLGWWGKGGVHEAQRLEVLPLAQAVRLSVIEIGIDDQVQPPGGDLVTRRVPPGRGLDICGRGRDD